MVDISMKLLEFLGINEYRLQLVTEDQETLKYFDYLKGQGDIIIYQDANVLIKFDVDTDYVLIVRNEDL